MASTGEKGMVTREGYCPTERRGHRTVVIKDKLYLWGGYRRTYHLNTHSSTRKLQYLSQVFVLDIKEGLWAVEKTAGEPPLGLAGYSCTSINHILYFFGGDCRHKSITSPQCSGYHNNLSQLDTAAKQWLHLCPSSKGENGVMKRAYGGMISVTLDDGEELLLIIGGEGPLPAHHKASTCTYDIIPDLSTERVHCTTNECNIFNVSQQQWMRAQRIGESPPSCSGFSFNKLPNNRGIMFGGKSAACLSSDVYIVEILKRGTSLSHEWQKIANSRIQEWPCARRQHSAVAIGCLVVVLGGITTSNCWLFDTTTNKWQKLEVPEHVADCWDGSLSLCQLSTESESFALVVFGGVRKSLGTQGITTILVLDKLMKIVKTHSQLRLDTSWYQQYCNAEMGATIKQLKAMNDQSQQQLQNITTMAATIKEEKEELVKGTTELKNKIEIVTASSNDFRQKYIDTLKRNGIFHGEKDKLKQTIDDLEAQNR